LALAEQRTPLLLFFEDVLKHEPFSDKDIGPPSIPGKWRLN
jgi:hypothetical protein